MRSALQFAVESKFPRLPEFVARRMLSGDVAANPAGSENQSRRDQTRTLRRVARGFGIQGVGEGGVVYHEAFRNLHAVQTHPLDRETPCIIHREISVPTGKKTVLKLRVSHHPHGDWKLRVLAGETVLADQIVGPDTVGKDEWANVAVDLTEFAGKTIELSLENRANNWNCEWAYWNEITVVSR